MEYPNGGFYVEVKDERYIVHPRRNNKLKLKEEPKSLRTQYQVQINTGVRRK